jgi:hypothetical protein
MAVDMSDVSQGPGWWQAADGKWYPPAPQQPPAPPAPPAPPTFQAPGAPPAYYPHATGPKNDGLSIAALVCGISGLATLVLCGIGIIPAILGVIFGIIGKKKVEQSGGALQGRGMALAGAICGAVAIGLFLIWLLLVVLGAFNSDSSSY